MTVDSRKEPIAIVGIGCRLPGDVYCAADLWNLLLNKTDAISEIPENRWNKDFYYTGDNNNAGKVSVRHGGFVKDIDRFDAAFFGISPVEALRIDPQHRLLLETAYNALDDAGIPVESLSGSDTGVFVGISSHDYGDIQNSPSERQFIGAHSSAGGAQSIAANRISYTFNLKGPSFIVDTACSSSLVAAHLACRSLRSNECSIALIGGVNAIIKPEPEMCFSRGGFLSPDGRCKTFDSRANGYIRSEGCGVIVVKPLSKALRDGNRIYATIIGSAVNQDGKTNGISLPDPQAQIDVMQAAYRDAEIDPALVDYVEAHGTGTAAGDPIEAQSIGTVIGKSPNRKGVCYVGSVKTNIGHLEPASGVAGLMKLSLAMSHRTIPPNVHFRTPNPKIDFDGLRLKVPVEQTDWPSTANGGYAGINSFGFGGTNAHLVLKGASVKETAGKKEIARPHLFTASATTEQALTDYCNAVVATLETGTGTIKDICGTAANHKSRYAYRAAVYARSAGELKNKLVSLVNNQTGPGMNRSRILLDGEVNTVFVFSGQGPQWWAMGRELYRNVPVFKTTVEQINVLFREVAGWSLLEEFLKDEKDSRINETVVAQPAIFALQVALHEYWKSLGVEPSAVVGHSVGEVAAAYASGSLSLNDAVTVIYHRSRIQDKATGKGIMAALGVSRQRAQEYIAPCKDVVSIAAINGPAMVTISGDTGPVEEVCFRCEKDGVFNRILVVNVPFHSHHMEPLQDELVESLRNITAGQCSLRLYSTVTGGELKGTVQDGGYWFKNVRQPVRFTDAVESLIDDGYNQFVEISPHPILSAGIADLLEKRNRTGIVVPSITRKKDEIESMYTSLGKIYVNGGRIDFRKLYGDYLFVNLPPYPFQRERFWLETNEGRRARLGLFDHPHLKGRRRSIKDGDMVIWDVTLDPKQDAYLEEHKVQGPIVFPGAGHVELGISAALASFGDAFEFLEDIHFKDALFLPDGGEAPKIQLEILNSNGNYYLYLQKSDGSWTMCSHGRVNHVGGVFSSIAIDIGEIRNRVKNPVNIGELHANLDASGLQLGPSFRAIRELYNSEREAFGIVQVPASLEGRVGNFNLHPAILDSCFQTLFGAFFNTQEHINRMGVYIPVHIDRVKFYKKAGSGSLMVYSRLNRRDESFAMGDIWIFDADGGRVAEFQGLLTKYLNGSRGEKAGRDEDWYYEFTWKQRESEFRKRNRRSYEFITNTAVLAPVIQEAIEAMRGNVLSRRFYDNFEPRFDDLCHRYIIEGLAGLGIEFAPGKTLHVDEEEIKCGVTQRHHRLFHHVFRLLEQGGYCGKTGEGVLEVIRELPCSKSGDVQKEMDKEFPEFRLELNLLGRCGPRIAEVVRGEVNPVELIFPQKQWDETVRYYVESYSFSRYNDMVAAALKRAVDDIPGDRSIRVLEIGAGTGGVTQAILPLLPGERTEYYYTDISEMFLLKAREKFSAFPFVKCMPLNIETADEHPGVYKNSFDIVIASDVIHATMDVEKTLENVKSFMGSGALLVMLEVTRPPVYLDLIFGMTEGWWRYGDSGLRQDHATMDGAKWRGVLEKTGFSGICLKSDFPENDKSCQNVILAHAPVKNFAVYEGTKTGPAEKRKWLVFEDGKGVAGRIAGKIGAGNADVVWVRSGSGFTINDGAVEMDLASEDDFSRLFDTVEGVDNILFACALDTGDNDAIDGDTLVSDADRSSLPLIRLMKTLDERTRSPQTQCPVWMLTSGAQAVRPGEIPRLSQAGFRGTARTIANEFPRFRTSLIDLGEKITDGEIDMVVEELDGRDVELEVAFRGRRRYVNILGKVTPAQARRMSEREVPVAGTQFILDIDEYGSPDAVCLRKSGRRECAGGEVEVQVEAAALNFRDIMVAMGLLPDEAVSGGLYGKTLGLECAGNVTAVGPGVTSIKPGDAVFGFARHSISGYTYARECHMFKADGALSMPEYAGLPIVYLTAYYSLVHQCRLQKGEKILIHSAAGGVGIAAVQIARALGAEVFATAGSDEKREYLRRFGVENIYDSRNLDFRERIMDDTGGYGVDVVINALSGHAIYKGISCLAPFGRFVEIGKNDIYNNSSLGMKDFGNNISLFVVDVDRMLGQKAEMAGRVFGEAMTFFRKNRLVPHPVKVFPVGRIREALRYMAGGRHIGKVVLSSEGNAVLSPGKEIVFRKDASYLISGGCSGFGLAVARWMSRKGAGTLVLVSRGGVRSDEDRAVVEEMEKGGTKVYIEKCDVADTVKMMALMEKIKRNYPPLKGVHHCAMVLRDTPVSLMDREKFMTAYLPKVAGAWNLHTMTKELELDFFVNYSSISSVFGNPGQANYAAANSFLDELTDVRNGTGLPCITINWGVLGGTGFVSRTENIRNHLAKQGWYAFSLDESLGILEKMLLLAPRKRVAINADWAKIAELYPHIMETARFGELVRGSRKNFSGAKGTHGGRVRDELMNAPEGERFDVLFSRLKKTICGILGIATEKVDERESITRLGLDSLMANEIRSWIGRDLGIEYSLMRIMKGPCIPELTEQLLEIIANETGAAGEPVDKSDLEKWVVRTKILENPRKRMFCFPYFAGGASVYNPWQNYFGDDIEVCPVQFPGREERTGEPVIDDVTVLVKEIAGIIRPLIENVPFVFYGHSMGALIAFELEKYIEKEYGLTAEHLIAGGWKAPQVGNPFSVLEKVTIDEIYDPKNTHLIVEHMRSLGIPGEVLSNNTLIQEMLPALQADIVMGKRYKNGGTTRVRSPITAIAGDIDSVFGKDQLRPWKDKTEKTFHLKTIEGGHLFVRDNRERLLPMIHGVIKEETIHDTTDSPQGSDPSSQDEGVL